jgi:hypothetical protein
VHEQIGIRKHEALSRHREPRRVRWWGDVVASRLKHGQGAATSRLGMPLTSTGGARGTDLQSLKHAETHDSLESPSRACAIDGGAVGG